MQDRSSKMLPVGPAPLLIATVAGGLLIWKSETPLAVGLLWTLALLVIIFSGLLVSEIPLYSFKFRNLAWRQNYIRYIIIISSVILLIALRFAAIPLIIILYILISLAARPKQAQPD